MATQPKPAPNCCAQCHKPGNFGAALRVRKDGTVQQYCSDACAKEADRLLAIREMDEPETPRPASEPAPKKTKFAPPPATSREARKLARRTDGGGSHAAAENIVETGRLDSNRRIALEAVARFPGHKSKELAELDGRLDRHEMARRLTDVRDKWGMVVSIPGPPGDAEFRWYEAGTEPKEPGTPKDSSDGEAA